MTLLGSADVASMIGLVAVAGDPRSDMSVAQRRRQFFKLLQDLVPADGWVWTIRRLRDAAELDYPVDVLDGGWKTLRERRTMLRIVARAALEQAVAESIQQAVRMKCDATLNCVAIFDEEFWKTCKTGKAWRAAGFNYFIACVLPLDDQSYSGVWLCRKSRSDPFTPRDCHIVHVLVKNVEWLHQHTPDEAVSSQLLTPRELDVLERVLRGDSRKEIAIRLKMSIHTVADHLKVIYRKYGVSSRNELLARFIAKDG